MDVSHAILFLENADFVRITGLYFPAKFELIIIDSLNVVFSGNISHLHSIALFGKAATAPMRKKQKIRYQPASD